MQKGLIFKNLKSIFIIILVILLVFLFAGCTPKWVNRVTEIYDIVWESDNPQIQILILEENKGTSLIAYIEINGQRKDFDWACDNARFMMTEIDEFGNGDWKSRITGTYKLINDEELHLTVSRDDFFDGVLAGKTIILKARKIDNAKVDAIYRSNVMWNAIDDIEFSFKVKQNQKKMGTGSINNGTETIEITFYFLEENRFEIYRMINDEKGELVLSGTYESNHLNVVLTIENDNFLNNAFDVINIKARELKYNE